jgi:hypothetical protein
MSPLQFLYWVGFCSSFMSPQDRRDTYMLETMDPRIEQLVESGRKARDDLRYKQNMPKETEAQVCAKMTKLFPAEDDAR